MLGYRQRIASINCDTDYLNHLPHDVKHREYERKANVLAKFMKEQCDAYSVCNLQNISSGFLDYLLSNQRFRDLEPDWFRHAPFSTNDDKYLVTFWNPASLRLASVNNYCRSSEEDGYCSYATIMHFNLITLFGNVIKNANIIVVNAHFLKHNSDKHRNVHMQELLQHLEKTTQVDYMIHISSDIIVSNTHMSEEDEKLAESMKGFGIINFDPVGMDDINGKPCLGNDVLLNLCRETSCHKRIGNNIFTEENLEEFMPDDYFERNKEYCFLSSCTPVITEYMYDERGFDWLKNIVVLIGSGP